VVLPAFVLTDFWWNRIPLRSVRANWKLYATMAVARRRRCALEADHRSWQRRGALAFHEDFTRYQYLFTEFRCSTPICLTSCCPSI
jgi:hypothetical protein